MVADLGEARYRELRLGQPAKLLSSIHQLLRDPGLPADSPACTILGVSEPAE